MVEMEELKLVHNQFLDWLKTKREISNINDYIIYVSEKYELYDEFLISKNLRILKGITRSLNRYRDEFSFDLESVNKIYDFFNQIDTLINQIETTQQS